MFTLTREAAARIREAAARSGADDVALRVAARREADGSIVYGLGFDEPREGDMPLEVEGIQLLIAPPSQALLQAMRLDFVETQPGESGFVFIAGEVEPEAPPRRGCGGGSGGCGSCGG
jgi:iron-sulfur cluster assembly protein